MEPHACITDFGTLKGWWLEFRVKQAHTGMHVIQVEQKFRQAIARHLAIRHILRGQYKASNTHQMWSAPVLVKASALRSLHQPIDRLQHQDKVTY